jgi:hypothetical protein
MAITASARKALADRSVSLLVAADGAAAQVISNAQLLAGATDIDKAQYAVYADFLTASYADLAALIAAVAANGIVASVIGANAASSAVSWNVAANKAVLNFTSGAAADYVVRLSLAASIAS